MASRSNLPLPQSLYIFFIYIYIYFFTTTLKGCFQPAEPITLTRDVAVILINKEEPLRRSKLLKHSTEKIALPIAPSQVAFFCWEDT